MSLRTSIIKRSMEDATFKLNRQGELGPEQVSAHVLRYFKELAEQRLGEPAEPAGRARELPGHTPSLQS